MITLIASIRMTCVCLYMAELLPFRPRSTPPSKCSSIRCGEKLICPSCGFVACSSSELHTHVAEMHPPTSGKSKTLQFGPRAGVVEELP